MLFACFFFSSFVIITALEKKYFFLVLQHLPFCQANDNTITHTHTPKKKVRGKFTQTLTHQKHFSMGVGHKKMSFLNAMPHSSRGGGEVDTQTKKKRERYYIDERVFGKMIVVVSSGKLKAWKGGGGREEEEEGALMELPTYLCY